MNHGLVEELSAEQIEAATPSEPCTRQLLTTSLGYDRAAIDQFEDFAARA